MIMDSVENIKLKLKERKNRKKKGKILNKIKMREKFKANRDEKKLVSIKRKISHKDM